MQQGLALIVFSSFMILFRSLALGGEVMAIPEETGQSPHGARSVDLWTGEGASLAGIIFPHLHLNSALGASTSDDIAEELAVGRPGDGRGRDRYGGRITRQNLSPRR